MHLQSGQLEEMNNSKILNNKQWQRQQQLQSRLILSQKYPDQEFMLRQKLLSQKDLRTIRRVIGHRVGKKKGKAITALPILFQTNNETVF
jgi:hypothetical protein